jgi:hypothetical protein
VKVEVDPGEVDALIDRATSIQKTGTTWRF